jgi:ribonuclease Y
MKLFFPPAWFRESSARDFSRFDHAALIAAGWRVHGGAASSCSGLCERRSLSRCTGGRVGEIPLIGFVGLLVGLVIGMTGVYVLARLRAQTARALAEEIIANAHREAETTRRQAEVFAKEESLRRRLELDAETESIKRGLREQERRLEKRSDLLDQKLDGLAQKECEISAEQKVVAEEREGLLKRQAELNQVMAMQIETLSRISRMSADEAAELLLKRIEAELAAEVGVRVLKYAAIAQEACVQRSREILTTTIQRYAASHTAEVTVSTFPTTT